jgi:DNA polymerase I-like protein with 3'-5' exonuclease and polymerase domains
VKIEGPFHDIQIAEPLIDENKRSYSLNNLAKQYLGETKTTDQLDEICKKNKWRGAPQQHLWRMPADIVGKYAIGDVDLPIRIMALQQKELAKQELTELFDLESKLIPLLLQMRQRGVRVDVNKAELLRDKLLDDLQAKIKQLTLLAGGEVQVWANESVAKAFDKSGIKYPFTATGKASFRKDWLAAHPSEIAQLILEVRETEKLIGTFIESAILDSTVNGRIHCQFNQLRGDDSGTVTGRFSSSNPNLQQVPSRGPKSMLIRELFVPDENELWGRADYSQIEYRFLAHYGLGEGADTVRQTYINDPDTDYHQVCADLAGLPRGDAKNLNFAIVYGAGIAKVAMMSGRNQSEAKQLIDTYNTNLPFIKNTYRRASNQAMKRGYIYTILGRRRRFDFWESADFDLSRLVGVEKSRSETVSKIEQFCLEHHLQKNHRVGFRKKPKQNMSRDEIIEILRQTGVKDGVKRAFTYKSLNALLQGSSADMTKKAMLDIYEAGINDVIGAPLLTVHDELDCSVPNTKEGKEAFDEMVHIMENSIKLKIPVRVDADLGSNWAECK